MAFVVCQTKRCQQTYPIHHFGEITKDTKGVKCEKCGGILIDENGRANLSQHPDVIPLYDPVEAAKQRRRELGQLRKQRDSLDKQIRQLEKEFVY